MSNRDVVRGVVLHAANGGGDESQSGAGLLLPDALEDIWLHVTYEVVP